MAMTTTDVLAPTTRRSSARSSAFTVVTIAADHRLLLVIL